MSLKTFIFVGPSAIGKTYVASLLVKKKPDEFEQAKLYTTRTPRIGENATDRIFIALEEFEIKAKNGDFIVHDEFGGNFYGFDHDSLLPKKKHLLVNAWPWLIPQFSKLDHAVIIGMQAPENWQEILVERMERRGDSPETIKKRLHMITKDRANLAKYTDMTNQHGKLFTIINNQTIPCEIVPWIEDFLKHI